MRSIVSTSPFIYGYDLVPGYAAFLRAQVNRFGASNVVFGGPTLNKRVHIVGRKNSGKTTLIVDLVRELTAQGMRVGTIKHTHHHHELDTPGKDSYRHRQAGASMVGIMAPGMNAVFWPQDESPSDRYVRMLSMFGACDLVLVEGHATGPGVKVEVWRDATGNEPLACRDDSIVAIITDDELAAPIPIWKRGDIAAIVHGIFSVVAGEQSPPSK